MKTSVRTRAQNLLGILVVLISIVLAGRLVWLVQAGEMVFPNDLGSMFPEVETSKAI